MSAATHMRIARKITTKGYVRKCAYTVDERNDARWWFLMWLTYALNIHTHTYIHTTHSHLWHHKLEIYGWQQRRQCWCTCERATSDERQTTSGERRTTKFQQPNAFPFVCKKAIKIVNLIIFFANATANIYIYVCVCLCVCVCVLTAYLY